MSAVSRSSLTHLSDVALMRELPRLASAERTSAAALLAALAEADARQAFARVGYASLHAFCVQKLKLAPDVASKRIQAARAVREFPALLAALEDGRLNVSALVLVAPRLTAENFETVLAAAAGQSQKDLRTILAQRFPIARPDIAGVARSADALPVTEQSAKQDLNPVAPPDARESGEATAPLSALAGPAADAPAAPIRFPLHLAVTPSFRDKLAYARDLLGHAVPGGETAEVIERALDALIASLEKHRFGMGARFRPARRTRSANGRCIPMAVRAEVFRRDGGCCTFVGETGYRCGSRKRLQFDHVVPLARGGRSTPSNLRLRCHTHNQLEAERVFGREFMQASREKAKQRKPGKASPGPAPAPAWHEDVLAALRSLGFRKHEAASALANCDLGPAATLEQRVRAALQHLAPPTRKEAPAA